jgi:hypothetical protein
MLFAGCNSGCDGYTNDQGDYFQIALADTSNRFEDIYYPDFNRHFQVTGRTYDWYLRISKPHTTMYIKTRNRGWDTLTYGIDRRNLKYNAATECTDAGISMEIAGPYILSYSFDTCYFASSGLSGALLIVK